MNAHSWVRTRKNTPAMKRFATRRRARRASPPRAPVKTVVPSWGGCFFAVAFLSAACYTFGVYARAERNILSQGGYEDEEEILDRDPYRRAAAESSAGDDAVGGGGRYVIDGD